MISLRPASKSDIPTLLEIEHSVSGSKLYSPILTADEWEKEFRTNEISLICDGDKIVGSIECEVKTPEHAYISGFAIKPEAQSKGIGRKALTLLMVKLGDVTRIDLLTHPENEHARKLYESFGFKVQERLDNCFGDGEPRIRLARLKS